MAPVPDHAYVFTIAGRCGRHGCEQPEVAHAKLLSKVAAAGECPVDHASITTSRLIGDGGIELSRCPQCGRQIEPKMTNRHEYVKRWMSPREQARLTFIVHHIERKELPAGAPEDYAP